MRDSLNSRKLKGDVFSSISNSDCGDCPAVIQNQLSSLVITLENRTNTSLVLSKYEGDAPVIDIDLSSILGEGIEPSVEFDCEWFGVTRSEGGKVTLSLSAGEFVWREGCSFTITIKKIIATAAPGLYGIGLMLSDFFGVSWRRDVPIVVLSADGEHSVDVHHDTGPSLQPKFRSTPNDAQPGFDLSVVLKPNVRNKGADSERADPVMLLSLIGSKSSENAHVPTVSLAALTNISIAGWDCVSVPGVLPPTWRLTPKADENPWVNPDRLKITRISVDDVATSPGVNVGSVAVTAVNIPGFADGYGLGSIKFYDANVKGKLYDANVMGSTGANKGVTSFSVTPQQLDFIEAPATVKLSWATQGASLVTLSDYGQVEKSATGFDVVVDRTTTFVLTAYDSALQPINSATATVKIASDPYSLLPTTGMIVVWSGGADAVPKKGWLVCDGAQYSTAAYPALARVLGSVYGGDGKTTFKVPDLSDAFILGAGLGSAVAAQVRGGPDTHFHAVGPFPSSNTQRITTSKVDDHSHVVPSTWYARGLTTPYLWQTGFRALRVNNFVNNNSTTAGGGAHTHDIDVSFVQFNSAVNAVQPTTGNGIRPPRMALIHLIKT
jgi:microcystin-dependent protein